MWYGKYEYCGYCRYLMCEDAKGMIKNGKFKCDRENEWVFANARPLKKSCFWQRPNWQLSDCDEAISLSAKYQNFYITTTIFKMLGLTHRKELDTLYAFRHNYLDSASSIHGFLLDYDLYGPIIAKLLESTDTEKKLAKDLYENYLLGILNQIKSGDYENASRCYEMMYVQLKQKLILKPMKLNDLQRLALNPGKAY